jgi:hypothetical protein
MLNKRVFYACVSTTNGVDAVAMSGWGFEDLNIDQFRHSTNNPIYYHSSTGKYICQFLINSAGQDECVIRDYGNIGDIYTGTPDPNDKYNLLKVTNWVATDPTYEPIGTMYPTNIGGFDVRFKWDHPILLDGINLRWESTGYIRTPKFIEFLGSNDGVNWEHICNIERADLYTPQHPREGFIIGSDEYDPVPPIEPPPPINPPHPTDPPPTNPPPTDPPPIEHPNIPYIPAVPIDELPFEFVVVVNGTASPIDTNTPTHYDIYGYGGYRAVDNIDTRDDIPSSLLCVGALVYVESDNTIYSCDNEGNWHPYDIGNVVGNASVNDILTYSNGDWVVDQLEVSHSNIENGTISHDKLASNIVDGGNLVNNIMDGSIVTSKIVDGAITEEKMATGFGGFILTDIVVYDDDSPLTSTYLSLSSDIALGNAGGVGMFTIECGGSGTSSDTKFIMDAVTTSDVASGCSTASIEAGGTALVISQIGDDEGLYWSSSQVTHTKITLKGYIAFRDAT